MLLYILFLYKINLCKDSINGQQYGQHLFSAYFISGTVLRTSHVFSDEEMGSSERLSHVLKDTAN